MSIPQVRPKTAASHIAFSNTGRLRSILGIFLITVSYQWASAQGWVITYKYGCIDCCGLTNTIASISPNTIGGSVQTTMGRVEDEQGNVYSAILHGTFSLTNIRHQFYNGPLNGVSFTSSHSTCNTSTGLPSFPCAGQPDQTGFYLVYPRISISEAGNGCRFTFSATYCPTTDRYTWQVTDDLSSGNWQTISNRTTREISVTAENLPPFNGSIYGDRFLRAVDPRFPGKRDSNTIKVTFAPPVASAASLTWTQPTCNGYDDGKVRINSITGNLTKYYIKLEKKVGANYETHYQKSEVSTFPFEIDKQKIIDGGILPNGIPPFSAGIYRLVIGASSSASTCDYTTPDNALGQPAQMTVSLSRVNVLCKGDSTGRITANVQNGTAPRTIEWFTAGQTVGTNSTVLNNIPAGYYSTTVVDAKGCIASNGILVTEPSQPVTVSIANNKETTYRGAGVSCPGNTDGEILATVRNSNRSPVTYTWYQDSIQYSQNTSPLLSALDTGTYYVSVRDGNNCTASSSNLTLIAPDPITFSVDQTGTMVCPYDQVFLQVNNLNNEHGNVTYDWTTGESTDEIETSAGIYAVTVTDELNCSVTRQAVVDSVPSRTVDIQITSDYNGSQISCTGREDGTLFALVRDEHNNVVKAETYTWYKDDNFTDQPTIPDSLVDVGQANYKVVITYTNGFCVAETTQQLVAPAPIEPNVITDFVYHDQEISCTGAHDGTVHAYPIGGTGAYRYLWNTSDTTQDVTGLGAGEYDVRVTDVNGCIGRDTIELIDPEPVRAYIYDISNYTGFGVSCINASDGFITASGRGGTQRYTYLWSNGVSDSTTINLAAGNYIVTVTDQNGCAATNDTTLTQPADVTLVLSNYENLSCHESNDGFASLQPGGGVSGYTYSKDNGLNWQTENTFAGLRAGPYTFIVRDANGCTETVAAKLTQPLKIDIVTEVTDNALCSNAKGAARATVTGGTGSYTLYWTDIEGKLLRYGPELTNARGGVYTFAARDGNHCTASKQVPIVSEDGATSIWNATATSCFNTEDGSATITITGGNGPFNILWPDGQTTLAATNLIGGSHYVTITDGNNCTTVQTVEVNTPAALQLNIVDMVVPTCMGDCDGTLALEASGGVGNYSYEWNGQASSTQSGLCAGYYAVKVTDDNGCILQDEIELSQPDSLLVKVKTATLPTCQFGCDGILVVEAYGGNPGEYEYAWGIGGSGDTHTNLCAGSYLVSMKDNKDCFSQGKVVLEDTPALIIDLGGSVTLCEGQTYTLDPGAGWLNHRWESNNGFNSTASSVVITDVGEYRLETYNADGCVARDTFLLETSLDLLESFFIVQSTALPGDTVVMIDLSWPIPEYTVWDLPENMDKVHDDGQVVYGLFHEPGTYEIGLHAHLGECYDYLGRTVTVLRDTAETIEGGRLGYIEYVKEYVLHPNPTDGNFEVTVELIEDSAITLSVWHIATSHMISSVRASGSSVYQIPFDLKPLSSGSYVLRLDYERGTKYLRFIVN